MPFVIGDKVRLKSGSPTMTVEKIDGDSVICVWTSKDRKIERGEFVAGTLEKYQPAAARVQLGSSFRGGRSV
jgi:uncharacterized protein YodC (DUF2158 family)